MNGSLFKSLFKDRIKIIAILSWTDRTDAGFCSVAVLSRYQLERSLTPFPWLKIDTYSPISPLKFKLVYQPVNETGNSLRNAKMYITAHSIGLYCER